MPSGCLNCPFEPSNLTEIGKNLEFLAQNCPEWPQISDNGFLCSSEHL
jgi:hypothetical protein